MLNTQTNDFFARNIAAGQRLDDGMTAMERAEAAKRVADAKAEVACTQMMPELFARDTAFSTALLKSALFCSTERGARRTLLKAPIASAAGDEVTYSGEELRQDDQAVLLAFIKACAGELISSEMRFSPRALVREVLGWPDKGASVERLGECLKRLKTARVSIKYAKGGEGTLSFVSDYDMKPGQWSVWLAPRLLGLFAKQTTYLNVEARRGLTGLSSWLFGFVNADSCTSAFNLADLRSWAGSTANQHHFNEALKASLLTLKLAGVIESYEMGRTRLKVVKSAR